MGKHVRSAPSGGRRRRTPEAAEAAEAAEASDVPRSAFPEPWQPFGQAILDQPVNVRRTQQQPPALGRLAPLRTAAVAFALVGVVAGVGRVAPDPDSGDSVAMAPTGINVLRGIEPGEGLPGIEAPAGGMPDEPRQVAGPDPLPAPKPGGALAVPAKITAAKASAVATASERGIPGAVLAAYRAAAASMAIERPGCHLTWPILAGIGRIESGHARNGAVDADGTTITRIVGPALDGTGNFARIMDSDGGLWDGDTTYDRAVGPMQFLPGTWRYSGRDGNADGKADPNNVRDAALASATYLCSGGGDMFARDDLLGAIFRYNRSWEYVSNVLTWAGVYATNGAVATVGTGNGVIVAQPSPKPTGTSRPTTRPTPKPTHPPTTGPTPGPSTPTPTTMPTPTTTPSPSVTPTPSTPLLAAATGRVLDDLDRPVAGARVTVTGAHVGPGQSHTVTSAADGTFAVRDLAPGAYLVEVAAADGYAVLPGGERYSATLVAGETVTGVTLRQATASLSGRVFRDLGLDGDSGTEPGVGAVTVRLTGTDARGGEVDAAVVTDADGRFAFRGLLAGTYALAAPSVDALDGVLLGALAPVGELLGGGAIGGVPVGAGAVLAGFGFAVAPTP